MPYTVTNHDEPAFIEITCAGTITYDEFVQITLDANKYARMQDRHRVIVDARGIEANLSTCDIYDIPKFYRSLGIPAGLMVALVVSGGSSSLRDYQFYVTVCRNQGFLIEMFEDMAEAEAWLLK